MTDIHDIAGAALFGVQAMSVYKPNLSEEQMQVFEAVKRGENVHLTGEAGTGKSHVVKELAKAFGRRMAITASTGIAAVNIGGVTIHSWTGLGKNSDATQLILDSIASNQYVRERINAVEFLVIEEVSMISSNMLDAVDDVLCYVKGNDAAFGGLKVILVGDPLQLPPVKGNFYFESDSYKLGEFKQIKLTENHRQGEDTDLAMHLNRLRVGEVPQDTFEYFMKRVDVEDPNPEVKPVCLYSTNRMADRSNMAELKEIEGETHLYEANDTGNKFQVAFLDKNCVAQAELILKEGAQVMLLKNLDLKRKLCNGSVGTVVKCYKDSVLVKFPHLSESVLITVDVWEVKENGLTVAKREQVPLRLAWAITIHKSQGMTLDKVYCRMDKLFAPGQGYVAISRVRSYEGLYLNCFEREGIITDKKAVKFYESF